MHDITSPLKEYYPESFEVDMNGETREWMGIVLLPFIDAQRLLDCEKEYNCTARLTDEEVFRNTLRSANIYSFELLSTGAGRSIAESGNRACGTDAAGQVVKVDLEFDISLGSAFKPKLISGTRPFLPGSFITMA